MKRKELLDHFDLQAKNLSIVGAYKNIPPLNISILLSLSQCDFLKFFRIRDDYVIAATEKSGKDIISKPGHKTATGINISIDHSFSIISFDEINSTKKGCGRDMVDAVMKVLPLNWQAVIVMDYSQGFWETMRRQYTQITII